MLHLSLLWTPHQRMLLLSSTSLTLILTSKVSQWWGLRFWVEKWVTSIKVTVEGDIITLCSVKHSFECVTNWNCLLQNRKNNFIVFKKKLTRVLITESASSLSLLSSFFFSFFQWSLSLSSLQFWPQPAFTISDDALSADREGAAFYAELTYQEKNNNRQLTLSQCQRWNTLRDCCLKKWNAYFYLTVQRVS